MAMDLKAPCSNCPFRKEGGVPLRRSRVEEIGGGMLNDYRFSFTCHKTLDGQEQHCAGALLFARIHNTSTQLMQVMERCGHFDPGALKGEDKIWPDLATWLEEGALS